MVVRALAEIFEAKERLKYRDVHLTAALQFVEIYGDQVKSEKEKEKYMFVFIHSIYIIF